MEIIIKEDYDQICEEAVTIIHQTWKKKNDLVLGLPTGRTPLGVYNRLIELNQNQEIDFSRVVAFSLDEYLGLNKDHPQSFAYYMEKNFYRHINIKKENIFRLEGTPKDVDRHCQEYEEKIKSQGGLDVLILGIGRNGHIGFNEPSSSLSSRTRVKTLAEETVEVNSRFFENKDEVPRFCLTMGIGTIMESKMIILLASGEDKSEAVQKSMEGPVTASVPASILQLHPQAKIIIDQKAASRLIRRDYYQWVYRNKERVSDFLERKKTISD
ncbi:MAG: glucosamine-6-phosphate deaminase [Candidatus Aminicenantes bacterium]|nr:glucosamine-6-phosphate deaminase [Candidatus Aminicenantes bacterium]